MGFSLREKGSLVNSTCLSRLVEAITSRLWEEYFEESKGENSAEMFEIFRVDEEVLSTKESSPLEVSKHSSGLREKDCDESFSNEIKISFNF